jgi:ornithine--oxo-acid transaminase
LLARGVPAKDAHEGTIRIAPPLVKLDWGVEQLAAALGTQRAGSSTARSF